jgi:hypothetical protein
VPLRRAKVAGAEVRASIFIPSQVACPSGTIGIAVGIAPEVGIVGSDEPFTVIIPPFPLALELDAMPGMSAIVELDVVVVRVAAAACGLL